MVRPLVVIGAGGRIGRLLRHLWAGDILWLTRADWDVLTPPPALPQGAVWLDLVGVTQGDFSKNQQLTAAVAQAVRAVGGRMIHLSSAAVYPGGPQDMVEALPPSPPHAYGLSKQQAETALRNHCPRATILRLGNVAGIDALLGQCPKGQPIMLDPVSMGNGGPVRSYIGPGVLAAALRSLCDTAARDEALPAVMNLCQPGAVAMADLLNAAGVHWAFGPPRPGVVPRVVLSTALQSAHLAMPRASASSLVADLRGLGPWP